MPERSIAAVKIGAPTRIFLDAHPDRAYAGKVTRIWPTANSLITVQAQIVHPMDARTPPPPRIADVYVSLDARSGSGPTARAALRGGEAVATDTSVAARWDRARRLAVALQEAGAVATLVLGRAFTAGTGPHGRASFLTVGWESTCRCFSEDRTSAIVLDPFCGAGTTGVVALRQGRRFVGIDLSPSYVRMARRRLTHR